MSEFEWIARSGLETVASAAHGRAAGASVAQVDAPPLALVIARRGKPEDVTARTEAHFGVKPAANRFAADRDAWAIWTGPGQFLLSVPADKAARTERLAEAYGGIASVSDQSDARILVEVSGAGARDVLCRVCSLDLDDSVFPVGHCAGTSMDHIAVNLWRMPDGTDGAASFRILVARSFAASLWESLQTAAGH